MSDSALLNPAEGHAALRIAGHLYSFETLANIVGVSWFMACREFGRRHPHILGREIPERLLESCGIPLTPGGEIRPLP